MAESEKQLDEVIGFWFYLKLCFIAGFSLGFIIMPFYAVSYMLEQDWISSIVGVVGIPFSNGVFVSIYGLFGYPLYLYMARKNLFNMNKIEIKE